MALFAPKALLDNALCDFPCDFPAGNLEVREANGKSVGLMQARCYRANCPSAFRARQAGYAARNYIQLNSKCQGKSTGGENG